MNQQQLNPQQMNPQQLNPQQMNPQLNEDVEGVIKSFVPQSSRLLSLIRKYNMAYLKAGLEKKTVKQLQYILTNIIATVTTGFLSEYKWWFFTVGVDVPAAIARPRIPFGFLEKHKSTAGNKKAKIDRIIEFYRRLLDILSFKTIPRFYYQHHQNGHRSIHIHEHKKLPRKYREDLAERAIKLLCILTMVIKAPKAKPAVPTPNIQTIPTVYTEVD
jgi:hypothetical protein